MTELYFKYICQLVGITEDSVHSKLAEYLMRTPFNYTYSMDGNREIDGINLRYKFGYENGIPSAVIAGEIDNTECSMLEMLVALSLRANDIVTSDDDQSFIFWSMITNLGLGSQTNQVFDEDYCDICINRFVNHEYAPNGQGGLVTIADPPTDLRFVEIWDQVMWWLDDEY